MYITDQLPMQISRNNFNCILVICKYLPNVPISHKRTPKDHLGKERKELTRLTYKLYNKLAADMN